MLISVMYLLASGLPWIDSLSVAVGTITNTGAAFGDYGPYGSFAALPEHIKIFLMFLMWIGRLEITLALVFFTPSFWRDVRFAFRSSRKSMHVKKH